MGYSLRAGCHWWEAGGVRVCKPQEQLRSHREVKGASHMKGKGGGAWSLGKELVAQSL